MGGGSSALLPITNQWQCGSSASCLCARTPQSSAFSQSKAGGIGLAVKSAPAQNKPSHPKQIDPRINPNGVSNYDPMLMLGSRNPNMASGRFNDPRSNS